MRGQPSPRFQVEAWLPFGNREIDYLLIQPTSLGLPGYSPCKRTGCSSENLRKHPEKYITFRFCYPKITRKIQCHLLAVYIEHVQQGWHLNGDLICVWITPKNTKYFKRFALAQNNPKKYQIANLNPPKIRPATYPPTIGNTQCFGGKVHKSLQIELIKKWTNPVFRSRTWLL